MRQLRGLTQKELAQKMNLKPASVCDQERKGIYDTRTAKKYAKALECSVIFVLEELGE
jgi:ribosome-binding protein aMBF1 (putative translation factor)